MVMYDDAYTPVYYPRIENFIIILISHFKIIS